MFEYYAKKQEHNVDFLIKVHDTILHCLTFLRKRRLEQTNVTQEENRLPTWQKKHTKLKIPCRYVCPDLEGQHTGL